jgi:carboxypeptidase Taq
VGNIYDGIWLSKLNKNLPDWREKIEKGSFKEVKEWLTENVYRYANLYDPDDLVKHVTGKGLVIEPFISYLDDKFSRIYA